LPPQILHKLPEFLQKCLKKKRKNRKLNSGKEFSKVEVLLSVATATFAITSDR
jgi:hypothetical protein